MTDPAQLYEQLVTSFSRGRWQESYAMALRLLPFATEHAGVFGIAGMTCLELQKLPQSIAYLRKATELDPSRADFATIFAKALLISHLPGPARAEADRAMTLESRDPMTLDAIGIIYVQTQAHAAAVKAFDLAVSLAPTSAAIRLNLATALISTGKVESAERELETCIELDAESWYAHLLLAQIRHQTVESNHLVRLHALLNRYQGTSTASICLNLAIAKECEDLGRYSEAFRHTAQGKRVVRVLRPYSIEQDKKLFETIMRAFPSASSDARTGDLDDHPIFVTGMPRSGTTLVERILSSHPDVQAAGELQSFAVAVQQGSNRQTPFLLDPGLPEHIDTVDWKHLAARYLDSTRQLGMTGRHFVDKMPHNFLYIGFIATALPNAKILSIRRNPLDTCLSNFRQYFSHPSIHLDYSSDLLDTGRYYILFDRLMAHWLRVFPGRIQEVRYEDLVVSQEAISRQLIEHCGLSWNDACLDFEANPDPVATLSAQQVRRPMYSSSVGQWKNYATELSALRTLLREAGLESGDCCTPLHRDE